MNTNKLISVDGGKEIVFPLIPIPDLTEKRWGVIVGKRADGSICYISATSVLKEASADQELNFTIAKKLKSKERPEQFFNIGGRSGSGTPTGADPEVFVKVGNKVIPSWEFLGKKPMWDSADPVKAYVDGVQAEFSTRSYTCHSYTMDDFQQALSIIITEARKKYPEAKLTHECVVDVPYILENCTEQQASLGCTPSFNVYGEEPIFVPEPRALPLRFAGCHFHYGISHIATKEQIQLAVKAADAIAGVASVALLHGLEDNRRRQFYGKAGEYRLPPYGVEYRVFSSSTLVHPVTSHILFDLVRMVMATSLDVPLEYFWKSDEDEVRSCINELDVRLARKILKRNDSILKSLLEKIYGSKDVSYYNERGSWVAKLESLQPLVSDLITLGINNLIELPSMEEAWRIDCQKDLHGSPIKQWISHSAQQNCSVHNFNLKDYPKANSLVRKEKLAAKRALLAAEKAKANEQQLISLEHKVA